MSKSTSAAALRSFVAELLKNVAPYAAEEFGHTGPLRFKVGREAITHVDVEVEERLSRRILERFPGHRILGEESGRTGGDEDWVWHIDPIDGTLNYSLGIPLFSMTLAVARGDLLLAGGVMDPLRGELFTAARGEGAWLGNRRIEVSQRSRLHEAIISNQASGSGLFVRERELLHAFQVEPLKSRRLGSIALELAYVAAGRFDLLIAGKNVPQNLYDVAGGLLLVEEAGGRISDTEGRPFTAESIELVASNSLVHEEVLSLIRDRRPSSGEAASP